MRRTVEGALKEQKHMHIWCVIKILCFILNTAYSYMIQRQLEGRTLPMVQTGVVHDYHNSDVVHLNHRSSFRYRLTD
jgi:hypothetical protein